MNDEEILKNAPEGATHVDIDNHNYFYLKVSADGNWWTWNSVLNIWHVGNILELLEFDNIRSLADIRSLVEKDERIKELEKSLQRQTKKVRLLEPLLTCNEQNRITELESENSSIKLRVREIAVSQCADYPDVENQRVYGHLWAIEQTILGVMQANEDVHAEWEKSKSAIVELEKERNTLDNQLHELYHAMELISKIAAVVPRDTAILDVINCYRTGELLQAHELEQKAKGIDWVIECRENNLSNGEIATLMEKCTALRTEAKQLREGVQP